MMSKNILIFCLACILFQSGCQPESKNTDQEVIKNAGSFKPAPLVFNADSAYAFVEQQVAFGPRVPGTKAHRECAEWLTGQMAKFGAEVIVQDFEAKAFNQQMLQGQNIIGSINPNARKRILLAAHWDTRPFADQEGEEGLGFPIPGANDGASGVAVLLELARALAAADTLPAVGIDFIFFDLEDYGAPEGVETQESGWCLGSQYWAKNPHKENYQAYYGVLLDMVGARDAVFTLEGHSRQFAPKVLDIIWQHAASLGFEAFFQPIQTDPIIDDHYYVNTIRRIPMIDIIHYDRSNGTPFFEHWHTRQDNLDQIDARTLNAVGQTLMQAIFNE